MVVASLDDDFVDWSCAERFARGWGASLVNAGVKGHLGSDAQLGDWPAGRAYLQSFLGSLRG